MTITTTVLEDTPEKTVTRVVDTVLGRTSITTDYKAGTPQFNQAALQALAATAITQLNTAETMLTGGTFDSLTANARTAIVIGLVRQNRALIRLALNLLDSPT